MMLKNLLAKHRPDLTPNVIVEVGACLATDSLVIAANFPAAKVYAFECNPATLPTARVNAAKNDRVILTDCAVSTRNAIIPFFQSKTANAGCSSLYQASGKYDCVEKMPQRRIPVRSIRLDTFARNNGITKVDLLWLDAQGAELEITRSLGDLLPTVQAVWTEFCYDHLYSDQPLLGDLKAFFQGAGLRFLWHQDVVKDRSGKCWWGDAFFCR